MKRIGIFGGTFNPPHLAHKSIAMKMKKEANLDEIVVIPTFVPPHKQAKDLASAADRLQMCKLTFFEPFFSVSDEEIKRQGKSYTYDTLKARKEKSNDELFLIVGSDMLLSFDKWYRYEDILSMATLCAVSRSGKDSLSKLKTYAKEKLNLSEEKGNVVFLCVEPFELSSTLVRSKIKAEEDITGLVEEKTGEYIKKRGLYK